MKKNKPQEYHPTQITITNIFEALRYAETKGNIKHERKDPASPSIFVLGITNLQRPTATIQQAGNILNYTLKIINDDTIMIITNKLEYHKEYNRHTNGETFLIPRIPTSATTCVQSGNQKSTRLGAAGIGERRY
jgi:hypothetical protein